MFTKKGDAAVLAKLGDAPAQYREIGERLHAIIRESAPSLVNASLLSSLVVPSAWC